MHLLHVIGARPNFMKAAPVIRACNKRSMMQTIVHTGQHYDYNMSQVFFEQLGLPNPDFNLEVGSGSHTEQTAHIMLRLEPIVANIRPDWVVVYGDVNSTLAAALVCTKLSVPIAHVEAGLRSFDWNMPEEVNRVVTDRISDLLFTPSEDANTNLLQEGISSQKIQFVGNVMIDSLVTSLPLTKQRVLDTYPSRYALVTLHRPSNVDNDDVLESIMMTLIRISRRLPIIFPIHPRTRRRIDLMSQMHQLPNLHLIEPLGYLDFLSLERYATMVITDSGGIQEETTFLGVPCLTLRNNTERPVTVSLGSNILVGNDHERLEIEVDSILAGNVRLAQIPPLWDGCAAERIAGILEETDKSERHHQNDNAPSVNRSSKEIAQ